MTQQQSVEGSSTLPNQQIESERRRMKSMDKQTKELKDNFVPFQLTTNILKTKRFQLPETAPKVEKHRYTFTSKLGFRQENFDPSGRCPSRIQDIKENRSQNQTNSEQHEPQSHPSHTGRTQCVQTPRSPPSPIPEHIIIQVEPSVDSQSTEGKISQKYLKTHTRPDTTGPRVRTTRNNLKINDFAKRVSTLETGRPNDAETPEKVSDPMRHLDVRLRAGAKVQDEF